MYSGWLLTNFSGNVLGAHQKIDRSARTQLAVLGLSDEDFPVTRKILHFEGKNGPDGIKRKSPGDDDPSYFYDPFDPEDTLLLGIIENHLEQLTIALRNKDVSKSAYEAAWLSHAIVDGLTPAHHYPFDKELEILRGEPGTTRKSLKDKTIIKGDTQLETLQKNWDFWGAKGLFTTHWMFEWGVSSVVCGQRLSKRIPSQEEIEYVAEHGFLHVFKRIAREIALLGMYDHFYEFGWDPHLARQTRTTLGPRATQAVTLAWLDCYKRAGILL
jgi:hypothetical protein